jgi:hypothetical protein
MVNAFRNRCKRGGDLTGRIVGPYVAVPLVTTLPARSTTCSLLTDCGRGVSVWLELRLNNSTVAEGREPSEARARREATQQAIKLLRAEADRLERED